MGYTGPSPLNPEITTLSARNLANTRRSPGFRVWGLGFDCRIFGGAARPSIPFQEGRGGPSNDAMFCNKSLRRKCPVDVKTMQGTIAVLTPRLQVYK